MGNTPKLVIDVDASEVVEEKKNNAVEELETAMTMPEIKGVEIPEEDLKYMSNIKLNDEELAVVKDFVNQIDISNSAVVMNYGANAQKKLSEFSNTALEGVKTKDLGQVSGMITDLVTELKGFDLQEPSKGFLGLFKKAGTSIEKMKSQYASAEANIEKITENLENHQNILNKDVVMLDKLYESNLDYFKELSMYIMAGKQKLEQERATTLEEMKAKAKESGLPEDAQAANDFASLCDRFEKKLYDLELTRNISVQMAPQIRMIQNNDVLMVERVQSTINNTIPLWKNQMVLALGMAHAQNAANAQKAVTDLTNDLLKKNAETLKQGSIAIAQESERSVVDIATIKETNQKLIETFDEVIKIQEEGRAARANAENELGRIEAELKHKLLEIKG